MPAAASSRSASSSGSMFASAIAPVGEKRKGEIARPDWKDDEPPAARSARRIAAMPVSSVGTTTMRAQIRAARPSRNSSPGSSIAPTCWVMMRLTIATATSDAGIDARRRQAPRSIQPPTPACATADERERRARSSVDDGDHADIAHHAEVGIARGRAASRSETRQPSSFSKPRRPLAIR